MARRHRYPNRIPLLFVIMLFFSFSLMGTTDSRLHIGGGDWDVESLDPRTSILLDFTADAAYQRGSGQFTAAVDAVTGEIGEGVVVEGSEIAADEPAESEQSGSGQAVAGAAGEKAAVAASTRPQILVHRVRAGETLWDIARAYGTSVDSIMSANEITNSNRIRVGQELQILTVKGVLHPVAVGESLWEIAQRYRVSVDDIVRANEITNPSTIQPRDRLVIPGATRIMPRDVLVASGQLQRAFSWPLRGRISSPFGPRWGRMHNGIDVAVPIGTPVRAAADGRVTFSGWNGGYGNLVIIDHGNGVETRYAHNSRLPVRVGTRVERGQIVSYSGNTGNSTGPHLHFEIRFRNQPVDPMKYLR